MAGVLDTIGGVYNDAVSWIQSNLSPSQAWDYARQNWNAFQGIGPTIVGLQRKAKDVAVRANAAGRTDIANDMVARINALGQLNVYAGDVLDRFDNLNSVLKQVGAPGLGVVAIPVAYAAVIAALVGAMVYVFFHVNEQSQAIDAQQRVLDLVDKGTLTASQGYQYAQAVGQTAAQSTQTGLAGALSNLKGILVPLAVVFGAVYLLPLVAGGSKRGR